MDGRRLAVARREGGVSVSTSLQLVAVLAGLDFE